MELPPGEVLADVATASASTENPRSSALHDEMLVLGKVGPDSGESDHGPVMRGTSVFVGEGLPPVPSRIADRIRKWEFVEMYELLPELLADQKSGESSGKQLSRARGRKRVQDVGVWLQCFAVLVGVVANSSPEAVPGLMAYMVSIIRASQEYEGAAWTAYDAAFRRQAAATGQRNWSAVNASLYTICFTGKARRSQRCDNCLSAAHRTSECYALGDETDVASRVHAMETALLAFSERQVSHGPRPPRSSEVCRLFNEKRCNFRSCKYRHVCRWCAGAHAAGDCQVRQDQGPGPMRSEGSRRPSGGGMPPY